MIALKAVLAGEVALQRRQQGHIQLGGVALDVVQVAIDHYANASNRAASNLRLNPLFDLCIVERGRVSNEIDEH